MASQPQPPTQSPTQPSACKPTGLAIILGAGPTTASGIARILASPQAQGGGGGGNLAVALLSRTGSAELASSLEKSSRDGTLHAFATDTSASSLSRAFAQIRSHEAFSGLPLKVAIWNIKHSHKCAFEDETAERFDESLRVYVGGARNFGAECTKWMLAQHEPPNEEKEGGGGGGAAMQKKGTIIFTGTLGALRTNAQYAAYGAGRAGVRMLAQSLAREYSAKGIHVVHAIANGGITDSEEGTDGEKVRAGAKMRAESVGKTYLWLSEQECDLWVHELDMRPAAEKF